MKAARSLLAPERHDLAILLARVFAEQVGDPVPAALTRATTFALPRASEE
ncbi:MAG TPA: hypothetical protein VLV16_03465 [Gemmatimonadales bacterium]|nr:hypothetical protein [Gemmatimonadales bacterium]